MRRGIVERARRIALLAACGVGPVVATGCLGLPKPFGSTEKTTVNSTAPTPVPPSNGVVQAGFTQPVDGEPIDPNMIEAEKFYSEQNYEKAEKKFNAVADNTKNPPLLAEKARFFEAECLRAQNHYPKAADTYVKMLNDFPSAIYRVKAVGMMFQIANYWLEDTRAEIDQNGKEPSLWSYSNNYVHISDPTKPFLDQEGRALELLMKVHMHDPSGPYSDKALYMYGYVNFYRGNWKEADLAFTQLVELHDKSPLRMNAAKMAIMAKNNSSGGSEYDGQKTADALRMVQQAKKTMPELVKEQGDFLDRQIIAIRTQQADKDFAAAEFYRRTGHPGSAWFYYELVRRRYPNTDFAERAVLRMNELEKENEAARTHSDGIWGDIKRGWDHYVLGYGSGLVGTTPTKPGMSQNPNVPVNDLPKSLPSDMKP